MLKAVDRPVPSIGLCIKRVLRSSSTPRFLGTRLRELRLEVSASMLATFPKSCTAASSIGCPSSGLGQPSSLSAAKYCNVIHVQDVEPKGREVSRDSGFLGSIGS